MPTAIYAELLEEQKYELVKARTLDDQNWVWQEKHNGDRRLIFKNGNTIEDFNRKGEPGKGLSPNIVKALQQHPLHKFIIDVEFVGAEDKIYVFDMLVAGDEMLVLNPYSNRLSYLHSNFDGFHKDVEPIISAITREQKLALYAYLQAIKAEGFAAKELKAPYRQSNESGTLRYNFKVKFWKDLDAVVMGDSTKVVDGHLRDSVRLGLYMPNGFLKDICGASKKARYDLKPGVVVKVKYLYGTGTLDIVQIDILEVRDDKRPKECTIDQIQVNKNWRKK